MNPISLIAYFFQRIGLGIYYFIGNCRAALHGVHVGSGARISPKAKITNAYAIGAARIGNQVSMGTGSYINSGDIFSAQIGNWCSIGYNVIIGPTEHNLDGVTTSPAKAKYLGYSPDISTKTVSAPVISDEVWIGAGAIILSGIHIGAKSVIAAGAVVTKDVPSNEVWGGIPAKKIKTRKQHQIQTDN